MANDADKDATQSELKRLVAAVDEGTRHAEMPWGEPVGREFPGPSEGRLRSHHFTVIASLSDEIDLEHFTERIFNAGLDEATVSLQGGRLVVEATHSAESEGEARNLTARAMEDAGAVIVAINARPDDARPEFATPGARRMFFPNYEPQSIRNIAVGEIIAVRQEGETRLAIMIKNSPADGQRFLVLNPQAATGSKLSMGTGSAGNGLPVLRIPGAEIILPQELARIQIGIDGFAAQPDALFIAAGEPHAAVTLGHDVKLISLATGEISGVNDPAFVWFTTWTVAAPDINGKMVELVQINSGA